MGVSIPKNGSDLQQVATRNSKGSNFSRTSAVSSVSALSQRSRAEGVVPLARRLSYDEQGNKKHRYDVFIAYAKDDSASDEVKHVMKYMKEASPNLKFYVDNKAKVAGEIREI